MTSRYQRRAAARLGLEKEWHYQARETEECPGCGDRVKQGVAVCKSCGAILDREKAAALGLGQAVQESRTERVNAPRRGGFCSTCFSLCGFDVWGLGRDWVVTLACG